MTDDGEIDDIEDTAMSYDEWKSCGYYVKKGQKSKLRDAVGVPQFTIDQVVPSKYGDARPVELSMGGDYWREHEVPEGTYDMVRLPSDRSMSYLSSMLNPTHQVLRSLESHLDSVAFKHHPDFGVDEDEIYGF